MYWGFGGMHVFWWLFWIATVVLFFSFAVPVPRRRYAQFRETPLDVLRRRYAAGEITTAEYDERRERLADGTGQDPGPRLRPQPPGAQQSAEHRPH